ncbi:EAL domain-containing protein [Pseudomonas sp. TMP25]|uniref:putative bifunctional diguanylate cyclase/phosphodiesterase n=1 Tax=Pseudomonas sp. TMP25 TaxID=3136561 RepID=UPI00310103B2
MTQPPRTGAPSRKEVAAQLRLRAEASLQGHLPEAEAPQSVLNAQRLVHELQVHQIELQLQNEQLQTARNDAEAALLRYTNLYDFAPAGYFTLRADGTIIKTNLAGARMLGVERALLTGMRFVQFVSQVNLSAFNTFLQRVAAGDAAQRCEAEVMRQGHTPRTLQIDATFAADEQVYNVVVLDVTERNANEEQLQLAALVYQSLTEAIMVCDIDNRIVAINEAFTTTTGYSAADAVGQTLKLLNSGQQPAGFYQDMWQTLTSTGRWQGELFNRRKNGEIYAEWLRISTIFHADGTPLRRVGMFTDITEKKLAESTIWQQANYDLLTGLPNRNLFRDRLKQEIKPLRGQQIPLALLFIDLDHFKEVNDALGHDCGDQLLIEASRRISDCVREGDTVARLGGDEFTVILAGVDDALRIEQVAQMIVQALARPFALGAEISHVSASIGITLFPSDATDSESLLKQADQAMYQAKAQGRNRCSYFTATMQQVAQERMQLNNDLHGALAAGQLMVYYQPIIHLSTMRCVKAEALLRWRHPQRGMVGPADFIPLAEQNGLIDEIGYWVFCQAASQVKQWRDIGTTCVQVSVNKSPRQFFDAALQHDWFAYLGELNLPAASICIEITEGLLLDASSMVKDSLSRVHTAGMQISLDDFGTGYSALSYLKTFPIDYVKIDQSFVRDMVKDPTDQAIVEAIIVMAHKLGMQVVAEGVETIEQRDLLMAAGCDFAQGYLFTRPLPQDDFLTYLQNNGK